MQNGKIGVTTENIFPIIKKFLYSDHEIFLRELVSNAVDAVQKLRTLSSMGEFKGELGSLAVKVSLDTEKKILTISDNGIGMTAQEVEKYINQIAFSGAEEFMKKYENQAIIGHFGLGFYSSFMVADKVEVRTQSWQDGSKTVLWSCDGSPEYTLEQFEEPADQRTRGTDIILHLSQDSDEFAEKSRIEALLNKYCRFLPVSIVFGKVQEWKDGKHVDTDQDNIINSTEPLWTRKPSEITEEQYKEFYHKLYPTGDESLFNIHLNIDYPFNLTGILYFPKVRSNFELQKNKIQLYSNQVFVTDSVEGIVPEFLTLLHGVIDSPDIPLNVSRSYLQSDSNVKKISSYITRKVADRLQELYNAQRSDFESKWDDLKIFIEYGIVTDEKFAERATEFFMLKDADGKYFTLSEYKQLITANQVDKDQTTIYLYTNDPVAHHSYIEGAVNKGYSVLVMNSPLSNHFINWFESKNEKCRFVRVDSDVADKLIVKESAKTMLLTTTQQELMRPVIASQLPSEEQVHYNISFEPMAENDPPVVITRSEFMRRMKDMAAMSGDSMSRFYAQMPDEYTIAVNGNHPIVVEILEQAEKGGGTKLAKLTTKLDAANKELHSLQEGLGKLKEDQIDEQMKRERDDVTDKVAKLSSERDLELKTIGEQIPVVKQVIDLALLSNGMLKGEKLTQFIRRSVDLLK